MSLRQFHVVLIAAALALLAFLGAWAQARGQGGLAGASALGVALGLPYLIWFMSRKDGPR